MNKFWLITFEWYTDSHWKRENAKYTGCVARWFSNYCDNTSDDVRLIGATPITEEGFYLLSDGYKHGLTGEE